MWSPVDAGLLALFIIGFLFGASFCYPEGCDALGAGLLQACCD